MKKLLVFSLFLFFFIPKSSFANLGYSSVHILGVSEQGDVLKGVVGELNVSVSVGSGKIFVNTLPLVGIDTQSSARLARDVSCELMSLDCSRYDFFYSVNSIASQIGGPSAGGAMSLATIGALLGFNNSLNVAMTGTINPDGSLGVVGGVFEKVEVTKGLGFDYVFIPKTQSKVFVQNNSYLNLTTHALDEWGVRVVEVTNILKAFELIVSEKLFEFNTTEFKTSKDYDDLFFKMSQSLYERANSLSSDFNESIEKVVLDDLVKADVISFYEQGLQNIKDAKKTFSTQNFYVGASKSLQASINFAYALNLMDYYSSSNKTLFLQELYDDVDKELDSYYLDSFSTFDNLYDLELMAASLDRFYESKAFLSSASEQLVLGKDIDAIFSLSLVQERVFTSRIWRESTNVLSGDLRINFFEKDLQLLSLDELRKSESLIDYASTVLSFPEVTLLKNRFIDVSEDFDKGYYARSLFQSLGLRADSSLLMEVRGLDEDSLTELFESKNLNVLRLINNELVEGREPLLSISYYQFAVDFYDNDDLINALKYLNYAAEYSRLSKNIYKVFSDDDYNSLYTPLVQENFNIQNNKDFLSLLNILVSFFAGMFLMSLFYKKFILVNYKPLKIKKKK